MTYALGYFSVMLASALLLRTPHATFVPEGAPVPAGGGGAARAMAPVQDVSMAEAIR
jgi:hypothetical protein